MTPEPWELRRDAATPAELRAHLERCDASFRPPLHTRVDLASYADKLAARAARFEAWAEGRLVGLVAAYLDGPEGWITDVSVEPAAAGRGIASALVGRCVEHAEGLRRASIALEVSTESEGARRIYERLGFRTVAREGAFERMRRELNGGSP